MIFKRIPAPCKGCTERHEACHDHCPRFLEYRKKHLAMKEAIYQEKTVANQINELNYASCHRKERNKGALKHGYKQTRR